MFHYIFSVRRKPNTDTSDYQGLGTPDPHPTGHSLFKSSDFLDSMTVSNHGLGRDGASRSDISKQRVDPGRHRLLDDPCLVA